MWRRRKCDGCNCILTSVESTDLPSTFIYKNDSGRLEPFQRDKLFLSIYASLKHRTTAQKDATALTDTVIGKLTAAAKDANLPRGRIVEATTEVLKRFDKAAYSSYVAYHPL